MGAPDLLSNYRVPTFDADSEVRLENDASSEFYSALALNSAAYSEEIRKHDERLRAFALFARANDSWLYFKLDSYHRRLLDHIGSFEGWKGTALRPLEDSDARSASVRDNLKTLTDDYGVTPILAQSRTAAGIVTPYHEYEDDYRAEYGAFIREEKRRKRKPR